MRRRPALRSVADELGSGAVRLVALIAAAASLLVAVVFFGSQLVFGSKDACELFGDDVKLAVSEPTKAPDPDDDDPLNYGSCSTIVTTKFDANLPGFDRHSEHTVAGRMYISPGDRRMLRRIKSAIQEDRAAKVTPLPKLGPDAFLVTRTEPESAEEQGFGGLPDPAGALPLPATAYWANSDRAYTSASASSDGATVAQAERATVRLAELVNRRPVEMANLEPSDDRLIPDC